MPRDEVPPRSGGSAGAWDDWTSGDVESGDDNDEVEVQEDGVRWKDKHNHGGGGGGGGGGGDGLRVATWNCGRALVKKVGALVSWMEVHKLDVVAVQEVNDPDIHMIHSILARHGMAIELYAGTMQSAGVALVMRMAIRRLVTRVHYSSSVGSHGRAIAVRCSRVRQ